MTAGGSVAAFGAALMLTVGGAALAGQQTASAFSTGYGGAKVSCVVVPYAYPEYGISGTLTYCGQYRHSGGWA